MLELRYNKDTEKLSRINQRLGNGHPSAERKYTMKITDLIIDPRSLGCKFWLTDVVASYDYKDGRRTDNVTGYRYVVCLPEKGLEKINVKVDGKKVLDAPESGFVEVVFANLEVYIYWQNGQPQVGARATNVSFANKA